MRVKYTGGADLRRRGPGSNFPYVFVPGVYQEVKPEDEEFFKNKAANPNNPWEVETVAEKVGSAVDAVESVAKRVIKKSNLKGGSK